MAGININNLPQNLQQKLSPYLAIAKDIESVKVPVKVVRIA